MNQKYLQGLSSNMESPNEAVFFEATPENITAFLMQHQWAQMSAIGTVDDRSFLTARMGLIDTCPDQAYLLQKLLPIYAKVQMGDIPVPKLKTVPKEIALAEKCPKPDWNYLRWEGYSDKKYQDILSGKALLEMSWMGEKTSLELQVRSYYSGGNLALLLVDWSQGDPQPWGDLSVNLGKSMWLYSRSSDKKILALMQQMHELLEEAQRRSYTVVGTSQDMGTGRSMARMGLQQMMRSVKEGHVRAVLVRDLTRLSHDPAVLIQILEFLQDHDTVLITTDSDLRYELYLKGLENRFFQRAARKSLPLPW